MAMTECIVTASSERPIHDVAKDLGKAGLKVTQVLDQAGSIIGTCEPKHVEKLRSVRGVSDVSESGKVDIGPPDSPTTW